MNQKYLFVILSILLISYIPVSTKNARKPRTLEQNEFDVHSKIIISEESELNNETELTGDSSEVKWYSMPIKDKKETNKTLDEIGLNIHESKSKADVTYEADYLYWVDLRNAFEYVSYDSVNIKDVTYFEPQEKSYFSKVFKYGIVFIVFAAFTFIGIIIYLVARGMGYCVGPKRLETTVGDDQKKLILLYSGLSIAFICFLVVIILSDRQ